jgi:chromate transporter
MNESDVTSTRPSYSLVQMLVIFLRVGATGFGGAMALAAAVQQYAIERRKVATPEEFSEGLALGQLLPGPISVDAVAYLGYRLYGVVGALLSAAAIVFPAFLCMLILTPVYFHFGNVPKVEGAFRGISGAVVAIIFSAGWRMGEKAIRDWRTAVLAGLALVCPVVLGVDPSLVVLLAGAIGLLLFRPKAKSEGA